MGKTNALSENPPVFQLWIQGRHQLDGSLEFISEEKQQFNLRLLSDYEEKPLNVLKD